MSESNTHGADLGDARHSDLQPEAECSASIPHAYRPLAAGLAFYQETCADRSAGRYIDIGLMCRICSEYLESDRDESSGRDQYWPAQVLDDCYSPAEQVEVLRCLLTRYSGDPETLRHLGAYFIVPWMEKGPYHPIHTEVNDNELAWQALRLAESLP